MSAGPQSLGRADPPIRGRTPGPATSVLSRDLSGGGFIEFSHCRGFLLEQMKGSLRNLSVLALFIYLFL